MGSMVQPDEFTVLVTGFGPFKAQYPKNPSWEIASLLPEYLPRLRPKDPASQGRVKIPPVRILLHPEAIRVNYKVVRELVPSLWNPENGRRVDLMVHIGMAGPRPFYSIERRGHRDGYKMPDVDNEICEDTAEPRHGANWIWRGLPDELETDLDLEDVLERWKQLSPDKSDLRISEDAGHYLCDFIYFSSLGQLYKAEERRRVVFLHVPSDASPDMVGRGRDLVLHLIRSLVESECRKKAATADE